MGDKKSDIKITYSQTAYVQTPINVLDYLTANFNNWAQGDGGVCVTLEDLTSELRYVNELPYVVDFLKNVVKTVKPGTGDMVFHK